MIAATLGAGLESRGVETGIGFGDGKTGLFPTRDQRRQKATLLFVAAKNHDGMQPKDVHVDRGGAGKPGAAFGNRLHQYRRLGDAEPAPAIFRGHRDTEPARLGHRLVEFVRKATVGVFFEPIIVAKPLAQPRHCGADFLLLPRQCEGHLLAPQPETLVIKTKCSGNFKATIVCIVRGA